MTPVFFLFPDKNELVGRWVLWFFYLIKRKERGEDGGYQKEEEKTHFFSTPKIMFSSFLFLSFLIVMQG
jgi:hypothetical protein